MKPKKQFTKKNHYIPQFYLKQWSKNNKIFVYKFLVSHENVPKWSFQSVTNTAYHTHLYTLTDGIAINDYIEDWMNVNIETPAISVVNKLKNTNNLDRLTLKEKEILFRFIASQYLRTPLGISNINTRLNSLLPEIINFTAEHIKNLDPKDIKIDNYKYTKSFPLKIDLHTYSSSPYIYMETITGKLMTFLMIQYLLQNSYKILLKHNWKILNPPKNKFWLTSDNPSLFVNYNSKSDFNFDGGWDSKNTNIIFPISPKKLLYTQIGKSMNIESNNCSNDIYHLINYIICHGAYREVYSIDNKLNIAKYRNRIVDSNSFKKENEYWNNTHKLLEIEKEYL